MKGHNKYTFKQLRKYFIIILGSQCCICDCKKNLEIHHRKGLLCSPVNGKNLKRVRKRCNWKFYFIELEISLKHDNLELRCKKHHNNGKLHTHIKINQTRLDDFGITLSSKSITE